MSADAELTPLTDREVWGINRLAVNRYLRHARECSCPSCAGAWATLLQDLEQGEIERLVGEVTDSSVRRLALRDTAPPPECGCVFCEQARGRREPGP